ncbi:MAG: hypothetical protein QI197_05295 [Candidatus Korarchaeota archaeon]|nr:hypothetical protein [Candidatus Korarchaeota archaeon]
MSVEKAARLLEEDRIDLKVGNYNKSASASYFAARMMVEFFLSGLESPQFSGET